MEQTQIFLIILGMMLVTYIPRALPMLMLSSRTLPAWLDKWLQLIPAAVLAALLAPALFIPEQQLDISIHNPFLIAALPTLLVACLGRSFVLAILTGMTVMAILRYFN